MRHPLDIGLARPLHLLGPTGCGDLVRVDHELRKVTWQGASPIGTEETALRLGLMSVEDGFAKEFALASHVETNRADDAGTPHQNEHCSGFCPDHAAAKKERS